MENGTKWRMGLQKTSCQTNLDFFYDDINYFLGNEVYLISGF